jgi:hypothetical protein
MPKAYAEKIVADRDLYETEIELRKHQIKEVVEEQKWLVELVAMLALNTGIVAILAALLHQATDRGMTLRLASGIATCIVFIILLWNPTIKATRAATEAVLMKARWFFFIPYGLEERHVVLKALWRTLSDVIYLATTWGTGLLIAEMIKTNHLIG